MPPHFDPDEVGKVWRVPYQQRAAAAETWARRHRVASAALDSVRIGLMLVDCQNTFCVPGYELFVGGRSGNGAVEDNIRLCEFIYRNLALITKIIPTLDTHVAMQIFHPVFWVDSQGEHPTGGRTIIHLEEVQSGKWRVNPPAFSAVAGPG